MATDVKKLKSTKVFIPLEYSESDARVTHYKDELSAFLGANQPPYDEYDQALDLSKSMKLQLQITLTIRYSKVGPSTQFCYFYLLMWTWFIN